MYDELIIEEIKRRNRIKEEEDRRPTIELEIEIDNRPQKNSKLPVDDLYGKVITIDLDIED